VQQHFRNVDEADPQKKHLLLTSRAIGIIDLAGAELLAKEAARRRKTGGRSISGGSAAGSVQNAAPQRPGRYHCEEQIFSHKGDAIKAIYPRLDSEICRTCTARIFRECHIALPDGTRAKRPAKRSMGGRWTAPAAIPHGAVGAASFHNPRCARRASR